MSSTLTTFAYITENSLATPGLWNSIFSILSANDTALNTSSFLSGGLSLSTQGLTINVPSTSTDYIFLNDSSGARSNYIIGSFTTGTADGLNIWDASGQTMIVSFSKQSVRFYQNVVGAVFDTGGALTGTNNAATFGVGSDSTESRIQAAINASALAGIPRVYLPASFYPYSASSVSFIYTVQMVREGGSWDVYDLLAYGGNGNDSASNTSAFQAVVNVITSAKMGVGYIPPGIFRSGTVNDTSASLIWLDGSSGATIRSTDSIWLRIRPPVASAKIGVRLHNLTFGQPVSGNTFGSPMILLHGDSTVGGVVEVDINNITFRMNNAAADGIHLRAVFNGRVSNIFAYPSNLSTRLILHTAEDFNSGNLHYDTIESQCPVTLQLNRAFNNVVGGTNLLNTIHVTNLKAVQSAGQESMKYVTTTVKTTNGTSTLSLSAADVTSIATGDWVVCADPYLVGDVLRVNSKISSTMVQLSGTVPSDITSGTTLAVGNFGVVVLSNTRGVCFNSPHFESVGFGVVCSTAQQVQINNAELGLNVRRGVVCLNGSQNVKVWYPLYSGSETTKVLMEVFFQNLANVNNFNNALIGPAAQVNGSGPASFLSDANNDAANNVYWPNPDTTLAALLGSATAPSMSFKSEVSLGWYSSAVSTMALSYGTLKLPGAVVGASTWSSDAGIADRTFTGPASFVRMQPNTVTANNIIQTLFYNGSASGGAWHISYAAPNASSVAKEYARVGGSVQVNTAGAEGGACLISTVQGGTLTEVVRANQTGQLAAAAGTGTAPVYAFQSESSLGLFRSATSTLKQSYGTLDLSGGVVSLASIKVKSGANNSCGTAVLGSNGSVNVANTYVAAGDLIFLTDQTPGGTLGDLDLGGIRAGSGFTIQSTSVTDTSTVAWLIIRPN